MFSLKIKIFFIILLSVIFTGEEIGKDSTPHIMFKKYAKFYYNLPYHIYFLFPRRGQDHFFEPRVSSFDFLWNLGRPSIFNHAIDIPIVYVLLFFALIYESFKRGYKARGFFFLASSVFNILSLFFIPQYVFLIGKYSSYKGLLRLNLETGFYLSDYINEKNAYKLKTLKQQGGIHNPEDDEICLICRANLWDDENGKRMNKDTMKGKVIALQCHPNASHYYHPVCVAQWLKRNPTCPKCKAHVKIEKYSIKGQPEDYMAGNGDLSQLFFGANNFFLAMMYADVTLCIDNFDVVFNNLSETYWFVEIILLRLGAQIISPCFSYTVNPFIGFCGISFYFSKYFILSLVPTYMIKDSFTYYPGKILLDIQLTFNFGAITLYK